LAAAVGDSIFGVLRRVSSVLVHDIRAGMLETE